MTKNVIPLAILRYEKFNKGLKELTVLADESICIISGYPHGSGPQSSRLTCGIYLQTSAHTLFSFHNQTGLERNIGFQYPVICSFHWFLIVFVASLIIHLNCSNAQQTHNNHIIYRKSFRNVIKLFKIFMTLHLQIYAKNDINYLYFLDSFHIILSKSFVNVLK